MEQRIEVKSYHHGNKHMFSVQCLDNGGRMTRASGLLYRSQMVTI